MNDKLRKIGKAIWDYSPLGYLLKVYSEDFPNTTKGNIKMRAKEGLAVLYLASCCALGDHELQKRFPAYRDLSIRVEQENQETFMPLWLALRGL